MRKKYLDEKIAKEKQRKKITEWNICSNQVEDKKVLAVLRMEIFIQVPIKPERLFNRWWKITINLMKSLALNLFSNLIDPINRNSPQILDPPKRIH